MRARRTLTPGRRAPRSCFANMVLSLCVDCVGNSYGLVEHRDGLALVPFDRDREIARVVSTYRRLNYFMQDTTAVHECWNFKLPSAAKRKLCEIPLVSRVYEST
jgi:hypothetical protein